MAAGADVNRPYPEHSCPLLAAVCGAPAQPIEWLPGAVACAISPGPESEERLQGGEAGSRYWADEVTLQHKVEAILQNVQERFLQRGYLVWNLGSGRGCGPAGTLLGLAPTDDKYAVNDVSAPARTPQ